jgi:thiamine-monophosphate kinase
MMAACRPYGVKLIGGDTSASKAGWFISIMLVGSVAPRRALMRSGARIGDRIYVTGTLGDAQAGLELLKGQVSGHRTSRGPLPDRHRRFLIRRHRRPSARITIGRWLSTHRLATAAIDLSDGLSGDLRHICEESRVGAEIELATLPLSSACRAFALSKRAEACSIALAGGEDYELLFTAPVRLSPQLERLAARRGYRITRIGTITPARAGIRTVTADGRRHPLPVTSYEHFRSTT